MSTLSSNFFHIVLFVYLGILCLGILCLVFYLFYLVGTYRQVDLPLSRPWRSSLAPAYKQFDVQQLFPTV